MLPGIIIRSGSPAGGDIAVNEAYDGLGATYDFYAQIFDRDSIDDEGLPMVATVHYDRDYTMLLEWWTDGLWHLTMAHSSIVSPPRLMSLPELAHGVTKESDWSSFQPGALNEHFQMSLAHQTTSSPAKCSTSRLVDWCRIARPGIQGIVRSMSAPGTGFDDLY
jgi:Zn-dependent metalloprotease